jgi:hypothetical protein
MRVTTSLHRADVSRRAALPRLDMFSRVLRVTRSGRVAHACTKQHISSRQTTYNQHENNTRGTTPFERLDGQGECTRQEGCRRSARAHTRTRRLDAWAWRDIRLRCSSATGAAARAGGGAGSSSSSSVSDVVPLLQVLDILRSVTTQRDGVSEWVSNMWCDEQYSRGRKTGFRACTR